MTSETVALVVACVTSGISLITSLASVAVPAITNSKNNQHQVKVKFLDNYINSKNEAFKNFLSSFEQLEMSGGSENFKDKQYAEKVKKFYASALFLASYVQSKELSDKLCECGSAALRTFHLNGDCLKLFTECSVLLRKEIAEELRKYQTEQ